MAGRSGQVQRRTEIAAALPAVTRSFRCIDRVYYRVSGSCAEAAAPSTRFAESYNAPRASSSPHCDRARHHNSSSRPRYDPQASAMPMRLHVCLRRAPCDAASTLPAASRTWLPSCAASHGAGCHGEARRPWLRPRRRPPRTRRSDRRRGRTAHAAAPTAARHCEPSPQLQAGDSSRSCCISTANQVSPWAPRCLPPVIKRAGAHHNARPPCSAARRRRAAPRGLNDDASAAAAAAFAAAAATAPPPPQPHTT